MKHIAPLAAAAALAIGSTGCSSFVPFTYELRAQHRLSEDEVKNLQFYSSHQITLRREAQSQDRQITPGHKLRLVSGKSVEEVVIPAKTPGVALRVTPRVISVSFVNGTSIDFVSGSRLGPIMSQLGCDSADPFVLGEATRTRAKVNGNWLGQFAEPPPGRSNPVRVVPRDPTYVAPADEPTGNYLIATDPSGQVSFAGLSWDGVEETMQSHLLIRSDKLEETEERRTVLPGVKLEN